MVDPLKRNSAAFTHYICRIGIPCRGSQDLGLQLELLRSGECPFKICKVFGGNLRILANVYTTFYKQLVDC